MLQWMGGSRRKIATSQKSTQKRQKHYFEQKRQQQQQTSWSENFSNVPDSSHQIQNNNRSLDVLSLLNLPTVVQTHRPQCVTEIPTSDLAEDYRIFSSPHKCSSNGQATEDPIDITETMVNASGQFEETVSPEKLALFASDKVYTTSNENEGKTEDSKEDSDPLLSVLSLISKDDQDINLKGRTAPEAHVAFSVEGLGRMGIETPPCSPIHPDSLAFPKHRAGKYLSSRKLEHLMDEFDLDVGSLMKDIELPQRDDPFQQPFRSRNIDETSERSKRKLQFGNSYNRPPKNLFSDEEIFYFDTDFGTTESWNVTSDSFDVNLDEISDITSENWLFEVDSSSTAYEKLVNPEISDFKHESPCYQNPRPMKKSKEPSDQFLRAFLS